MTVLTFLPDSDHWILSDQNSQELIYDFFVTLNIQRSVQIICRRVFSLPVDGDHWILNYRNSQELIYNFFMTQNIRPFLDESFDSSLDCDRGRSKIEMVKS